MHYSDVVTDEPLYHDYLSDAGWPAEANIAAREIKRLFKKDAVPPLTQLLIIANDPNTPIAYKVQAAEKAASIIYPRPTDACLDFDLGSIETAADLASAQAKVMRAMARGHAPLRIGKALIECLALMARTHELTEGPVATVIKIEGGMPELQVEDVAPDNVTPFRSDRDEQVQTQAGAKAG
jgi:hypothetical protein